MMKPRIHNEIEERAGTKDGMENYAMRINHNLSAYGASFQLKKTNKAITISAEKLASGLRINRAADDAAGLSISEKMRAQVRSLSQAERNTRDGISLVQTADGAMEEVQSMLARMGELAIQAANGTYNDEDRAAIQKEVNDLKKEINSIANNTGFNGIKLLDGSSFQGEKFTGKYIATW